VDGLFGGWYPEGELNRYQRRRNKWTSEIMLTYTS
jgi:hypothetical protein